MLIQVHLLPQLMSQPLPAGSVGVLIDVLRASTTIVHALAQGAREVIPCQTVEAAFEWKRRLQAAGIEPLLGGERHAQRIPGFDLDNSPLAYTREVVAGRTLVFTTTNGTRALQQAEQADEVLVGAFVNRRAVVERLRGEERPVHLICAGTDGHLTGEDILFAGAVVSDLLGGGYIRAPTVQRLDVPTQLAVAFYRQHGQTPAALREAMYASRGGRNLRKLGLTEDIDRSMEQDRFSCVPIWKADVGKILLPAVTGR